MKAAAKTLNGPLADIERKTLAFSEAREVLAQRAHALKAMLATLEQKHTPGIKHALAKAAELQADLKAAIELAPEGTFDKPRTHIFHGIKVGYRKATGKIEFDDEAQVVKLIRKYFPEQFDVLVKTEETPIKKALGNLSAAELKKLGIEVADTGDVVEVKPVDDAVDKWVAALLKDAAQEAGA